MLKLILFSVLIFFNGSCSHPKEVAGVSENKEAAASAEIIDSSAQTKNGSMTDSTKEENYRLIVSFYSIGSGAEHDFIEKFEVSIGDFSQEVHKNIDYEKASWGREGETDFCLRLSELNPSQQNTMIARTQEILKSAKWVHIYENQPCRHHPKR